MSLSPNKMNDRSGTRVVPAAWPEHDLGQVLN